MKAQIRRTGPWTSLAVALAVCWGSLAQASRPDLSVEEELDTLSRLMRQVMQRGFQDEEAFFRALADGELIMASAPREPTSVLQRMTGPFERRFYFGPPGSARAAKAAAFAVTATGDIFHNLAFCADTTPLVCVRRDGFEPRTSAGKCADPLCEVFARGDQVQEASTLFRRR